MIPPEDFSFRREFWGEWGSGFFITTSLPDYSLVSEPDLLCLLFMKFLEKIKIKDIMKIIWNI